MPSDRAARIAFIGRRAVCTMNMASRVARRYFAVDGGSLTAGDVVERIKAKHGDSPTAQTVNRIIVGSSDTP
jgi:hypothetical protein